MIYLRKEWRCKREFCFWLSSFSLFRNWSIVCLANWSWFVSYSRVIKGDSFLNDTDISLNIKVFTVNTHSIWLICHWPHKRFLVIQIYSGNFWLKICRSKNWSSFLLLSKFNMTILIQIIFFCCSFHIDLCLDVVRSSH